jgi:outer membrane receptor protein involved in Fe transport
MEMSGTEMESRPPNSPPAKKIVSEMYTRAAISPARGRPMVILSGVILSAFIASALGAPPAIAPFPESVADVDSNAKLMLLDIEPQPMADALTDWAQQTGMQLIVPPENPAVDRILSSRVKGRLTARGALDQLLAGTALTYEFINTRTVVIRKQYGLADPMLHSDAGASAAQSTQRTAGDATANPGDSNHGRNNAATSYSNRVLAGLPVAEVIVAGTHIRGTSIVGSRVQVLDRTDINATGYTAVQDVLKTIPANLGGGPSEDFDDGISGNFNRGTGINLRRLGAGATLVLVNGHRQAASGVAGSFVDVSSIPASAVSRIEILTDGASAVYGSDAIGGVVNIVLRDDYEGAETQVRYGVAGDPRERLVSQILGGSWDGGNALFGYQFYDRAALAKSARAYTASEDKSRFGGDDFRLFLSNPGNILNPATGLPAYAIPAGQDGASLRSADLLPGVTNLQGFLDAADTLPQQTMHSAFFSARQRVGDNLTLNADGRFSRREGEQRLLAYPGVIAVPAANPFFVDPFGGSPMVLVAYNFADDLGPVTGRGQTDTFSGTTDATISFARSWHARLSANYAEEKMQWRGDNLVDFAALSAAVADRDPATAFNPFGDGSHTNPATLDAIRTSQHERTVSTLQNLSLTTDGTLFDLPGGAAKLALGVDYREESLQSSDTDFDSLNRSIFAGFAEIAAPLIGAGNARRGVRQLGFSLAARYENYSDFGSTLNPRIGLNWAPVDSVRIRGNVGTSFKAPSLVDGHVTPASAEISIVSLPDPRSATGQSSVLFRQGRNEQLKNETATVWNAGLDFLLPGETVPTLSLTYYDIDFHDRIDDGGPPGAPANILLQESQWTDLIQREPSQSQLDTLCNSAEFDGNPADCSASTIAAIVDVRRRNLGMLRVQGIDLSFARPVATEWGALGLGLEGSYVLHYQIAASRQSPLLDIVDTVGNALALHLRGSLSWQRDEWSANMFVNYIGGYKDNVSRPNRTVGSWTTCDLLLAYQAPARTQWLENIELSLSAINLFGKDPPFNNSRYGYDPANADPIDRTIGVRITKLW